MRRLARLDADNLHGDLVGAAPEKFRNQNARHPCSWIESRICAAGWFSKSKVSGQSAD